MSCFNTSLHTSIKVPDPYKNIYNHVSYRKLTLITKFLRKISDGEIIGIRNIEIVKKSFVKSPDNFSDFSQNFYSNVQERTIMVIHYESYLTKGIFWNVTIVPSIEKMIIDIFGLKFQGIDEISLVSISNFYKNSLPLYTDI
jgi:hypothetical protein